VFIQFWQDGRLPLPDFGRTAQFLHPEPTLGRCTDSVQIPGLRPLEADLPWATIGTPRWGFSFRFAWKVFIVLTPEQTTSGLQPHTSSLFPQPLVEFIGLGILSCKVPRFLPAALIQKLNRLDIYVCRFGGEVKPENSDLTLDR
jgi:hypothetical protein